MILEVFLLVQLLRKSISKEVKEVPNALEYCSRMYFTRILAYHLVLFPKKQLGPIAEKPLVLLLFRSDFLRDRL